MILAAVGGAENSSCFINGSVFLNTETFIYVVALLGQELSLCVTLGKPLAGVDDEGEVASRGFLLAGCLAHVS